ncbi:dihydroneopterin aldolase [Azoarcus sp. KH32C]|uniref:dihydroneopterin aldolase n=1 Tax=Azoarcus sp. KH32C TaxID=748247 RepID=UPI0002385D87|nr:dihydroneopterin aldolase [Azoarcus sp. KH32C]BAL27063.1 dihydroneopterin aldolase [Azoarcus sp. KH32C]
MKLETTEAPALAPAPRKARPLRTATFSAPPLAGDDTIFLRGLRVEALIGVYEHERHAPQPLVIDLELGLTHSRACFSDNLNDAVDYGAVVAAVRRHAMLNRCELLEAFAQNVADTLLDDFELLSVAVHVSKPGIFDVADSVGVSIRRRRTRA